MMTLNEILPTVYQLPNPDKLKLIRLLAEDLDNSADDISPFEQNKVYFLATPYDSTGAAQLLLDELSAAAETVKS
jgi:hypothetical protein